ncbi:invasion associated locus B family protein [Ancylobacter sp. 6x-1]|uniref:Invasion associated locus B family protein n=1 Tax=Ancylobacter crimeensis TaxID=2579147 RepID=A0ABT0D939_9HYPH|nr:invasion associated locus B family protein [Ancylobacter crimeensis]MCK0196468.1 invasion associated locus B family protein [Ancylobacter crimeensis]
MIRTISVTLVTMILGAGAASAAGVATMGQFKNWGTYSYKDGNVVRCFTNSLPIATKPDQLDHGDVLFFLKAGKKGEPRTEASFKAGYQFAAGSKVMVSIGENSFVMITDGNAAWLRRTEREPELLAAMQGGSTMAVSATSARGNDTSYVFSLDGITAASTQILSQCR